MIKQRTEKKIMISCAALQKVSNVQNKVLMNKIAALQFEFLSKRFGPGPLSVESQVHQTVARFAKTNKKKIEK